MAPQQDDQITIGEVHRVCIAMQAQLASIDKRGQEQESRLRVLEDRSNRGATLGGIWGAIGGLIAGFASGFIGKPS